MYYQWVDTSAAWTISP